jgi:hypothetical protein
MDDRIARWKTEKTGHHIVRVIQESLCNEMLWGKEFKVIKVEAKVNQVVISVPTAFFPT